MLQAPDVPGDPSPPDAFQCLTPSWPATGTTGGAHRLLIPSPRWMPHLALRIALKLCNDVYILACANISAADLTWLNISDAQEVYVFKVS